MNASARTLASASPIAGIKSRKLVLENNGFKILRCLRCVRPLTERRPGPNIMALLLQACQCESVQRAGDNQLTLETRMAARMHIGP